MYILTISFRSGKEYLRAQEPVGTPSAVQMHALHILTYTFPLLSLPLSSLASGAATSSSTSSHYTIHIPRASATVPRDVNAVLEQFGLGHLRVGNHHDQHPFGANNDAGANPNGGLGGAPPPMLFNPHRNPGAGANAEAAALRQLALRGMFIPLGMLVLRTLILVYFVSPARKPIWGIIIGAYITYEAYRAIHNAIAVAAVRPEEGGGAGDGIGAAAGDVPGAAGGVDGGLGAAAAAPPPPPLQQQQQQRARAGGLAPPGQGQLNRALDAISHVNLRIEEEALTPPPSNEQHRRRPVQAPGLFHKITTFLFLMVATLHPAVWSRRRNALIQREGRIRTEARGRERPPPPYQQPDGEDEEDEAQAQARREEDERRERARAELIAQHERRLPWVHDYIERVRETEWVDDV
jgi:hypothetical protein